MSQSEAQLKYAAQAALDWMKAAQQNAELAEWIDPVVIAMLETAIGHSSVDPLMPSAEAGLTDGPEVPEEMPAVRRRT